MSEPNLESARSWFEAEDVSLIRTKAVSRRYDPGPNFPASTLSVLGRHFPDVIIALIQNYWRISDARRDWPGEYAAGHCPGLVERCHAQTRTTIGGEGNLRQLRKSEVERYLMDLGVREQHVPAKRVHAIRLFRDIVSQLESRDTCGYPEFSKFARNYK